MTFKKAVLGVSVGLGTLMLAACASQPPGAPATPAPASSTAASAPNAAAAEKDTASAMEKRFQDAARSYKVVQKNGKTLYCKREKVIGSTIPTMQCLTESELRTQVENMEEFRQRQRNSGRCTTGVGCGAGS
jgi:hypothetical protein